MSDQLGLNVNPTHGKITVVQRGGDLEFPLVAGYTVQDEHGKRYFAVCADDPGLPLIGRLYQDGKAWRAESIRGMVEVHPSRARAARWLLDVYRGPRPGGWEDPG